MKKGNMLIFVVISFLFLGIILMSGCVGEIKEEKGVDEPVTEKIREPPAWSFSGTLSSKNDSHTYELDLRDKISGCLLTLELAGHNPELIYLRLLDSNKTPIQTLELGYNMEFLAVVDGGEIYQMVVETRKDRDVPIEYTVNVRLSPHSVSNSSDTAVPVKIPGKFESKLIPRPIEEGKFMMDDINWFRIGPLDLSGLLVVDSDSPRSSNNYDQHKYCVNCIIYLLDDKLEFVKDCSIGQTLYYPMDAGDVYYMKIRRIPSERPTSYIYVYPFSINIDVVPNSVNNNPGNAIPVNLLEIVEGRVASVRDVNWFKLDLGDYSDGDIIINISFPDDAVMYNRMKMELLGENKSEVIGYVYAKPDSAAMSRYTAFKKNMPKASGHYPEKEIEGGKTYYIKTYIVNASGLIDPPTTYTLEVRGTTIVPLSVMDEEPDTYVLTSNTADSAITVNLPAQMTGRITSEDDVQWFKIDLSAYPNGGVLIVTLSMPTKTEPSCDFICRQPVCFNVPRTPPDCSHYQFEVVEGDKKTGVMKGSVAPKDEKAFRHVLERGAQYYFKVSAPNERYNKEEPYTIDVRFYPGE